MKTWFYAVVFFAAMCLGVPHGEAQESEPTLLKLTKDVVDYLDPTPEIGAFVTFKDLGDGNLSQWEGFSGISGALYKFTSHDIELGSVRLGGVFEGNRRFYLTLGINGVGLAKRYLPEDVKATLSPGFVGGVWTTLEKYGHVSAGVGLSRMQDLFADGYTFKEHAGVIGTVGLRIPF